MFHPIKPIRVPLSIGDQSTPFVINGQLYYMIEIKDVKYVFKNPLNVESYFSVIYRSYDLHTRQRVILKEYKKPNRTNYELEKNALTDLKHPNIVNLYSWCDDFLTLVLEQGDLGDLFEILLKISTKSNKTGVKILDEKMIRTIVTQLIDAIDYAYNHEKSYCHRDIKLENVVFKRDGTLLLIDWGFADSDTKYLKFNDRPGSPSYMSPEILDENQRCDGHKADIWSIGILMLYLYFGNYPFHIAGKNSLEIIATQEKCPLYQKLKNYDWDNYIQDYSDKSGFKYEMSGQLNDLFKKIFKPEEKRINSEDFRKHPFMEGEILTQDELVNKLQ